LAASLARSRKEILSSTARIFLGANLRPRGFDGRANDWLDSPDMTQHSEHYNHNESLHRRLASRAFCRIRMRAVYQNENVAAAPHLAQHVNKSCLGCEFSVALQRRLRNDGSSPLRGAKNGKSIDLPASWAGSIGYFEFGEGL
jgi:hypothetical protein